MSQEVYHKIRHWVDSLSCLGSQTKFIAVDSPSSSSSSVVLCNNILRVCSEVTPSSSVVSVTQGADDAERRMEERAAVSVFERTLAIVSKWIDPAGATAATSSSITLLPSGLHARVHCGMSLCFALKSFQQQSSGGVSSEDLSNTLNDVAQQCIRRARSDVAVLAPQQQGECASPLHQLARLAFHYHDGELNQYLSQTSSAAAASAFFLSLNNHAAFLACVWFDSCLKQQKQQQQQARTVHEFVSTHLHSISVPFPVNPAVAAFTNNDSCSSNAVLPGLCVWLLPSRYLIVDNNNAKADSRDTAVWEDADAYRDGFVVSRSFQSECGVLPMSLMESVRFDGGKKNCERPHFANVRVFLVSDIVGEPSMSSLLSCCQHDSIEPPPLNVVLLPASATVSNETLAKLAASKNDSAASIIFARIPWCRFEQLALAGDVIPRVWKEDDSKCLPRLVVPTPEDHRTAIGANFLWAAVAPDALDTRRRAAGVLLQLLVTVVKSNDDDDQNRSSNNSCHVSQAIASCTTVIFFRRSVSQLVALRDLFGRVVTHLWQCTTRPSLLIRGGGKLDCAWIAALIKLQSEFDAQAEFVKSQAALMLCNAVHGFLATLLVNTASSCSSAAFADERIRQAMATTAQMAAVAGPLEDEDGNTTQDLFPVDCLSVREEALLAAVDFACLVALGAATIERSWAVEASSTAVNFESLRRTLVLT